jgi:hypothetical protein
MSRPILGGRSRTPEQVFGSENPLALARHLRANPPAGLVFVPQAWSDFLVWAGPADLQPMVTSMIHLIPRRVWRDYMGVHNSVAAWPRVMDYYSIDTVVLDRGLHWPQISQMSRMSGWRMDYEDAKATVFVRSAEEEDAGSGSMTEGLEGDALRPSGEPASGGGRL